MAPTFTGNWELMWVDLRYAASRPIRAGDMVSVCEPETSDTHSCTKRIMGLEGD